MANKEISELALNGFHTYNMMQLIQSGATYKVFQEILHECAERKANTLRIIKLKIAEYAGVSRRHIDEYLDNLIAMGFIKRFSDDSIQLQFHVIYGIAYAFDKLRSNISKKTFIEALQKGDFDVLYDLGYEPLNNLA